MATYNLTLAQATIANVGGVGVTQNHHYVWDLKALYPAAAIGDVFVSPELDLATLKVDTNLIVARKLSDLAVADVCALIVDESQPPVALGVNPSTGSGTTSSAAAGQVPLVSAACGRYAKMTITLATNAMSTRTSCAMRMSILRD